MRIKVTWYELICIYVTEYELIRFCILNACEFRRMKTNS
jgi:hypothetical protein